MASVRTRPVLVALVAVLAIALAAATLNTAVAVDGSVGGGEGGIGDRPGLGSGSQDGDEGDPSAIGFGGLGGAIPVIPLPCYPLLTEGWFLVSLAFVASAGLFVLYRRRGALVPIGVVAAVGPPGALVYLLLTACRSAEELQLSIPLANRTANTSPFSLAGGAGGSGSAAGGTPLVSVALLGVLGLALLVAVALLVQSTGDDEPALAAEASSPAPERMAAIGRVAGRAATRIEGDADPDNAVYRAWKEMTDHLEVANPAASTPAEFATAAAAAGMATEDVAELTGLFEAVRYGTAEATADREARAIAALRRLEAEYAGKS